MDADQLQVEAKALGDPTRHRIFQLVLDAHGPVGVAPLTEALGLNHNAVRQHLAKLVAAGLVEESVAPVSGRGRPRLQYRVSPVQRSRWHGEGAYERLARWLAESIRTGNAPFDVGWRVGHESDVGDVVDDPVGILFDRMAEEGFEPVAARRGRRVVITLGNCPFESTAAAEPDTVCELHHGIAAGLAAASGGIVVEELVRNDPHRANCRLRCRLEPETSDDG